ncbi:MAG: hypothetical protein KGM46_09900 [Pseudomonadota bacterium]|nr:hypothetical protein [Xanthomonadaceae bacterium]MDE2247751.1 hypothetical protein [Xanthomonadaceae bacterium]MDE3211044.1 hypothetical protein [Pseudomonadota bacterium]
MKFEAMMLRGLFLACVTVCGLVLGAMLSTTPGNMRLTAGSRIAAALESAPSNCALPPDGVVCPRADG